MIGITVSRMFYRVVHLTTIVIVVLFVPTVIHAQCPVNPDCSCSTGGYSIYCYPKCGTVTPRFLKSTVTFYRLQILGGPTRSIHQMQPKTFDGLIIQRLHITGTGLTNLHCESFTGMEGILTYLDLENNFLERIPKCSLNGLRLLTTLDLDSNNITKLQQSDFSNLTKLQTLNLRNNKISDIAIGAFQGLETLRTLTLAENGLADIPYGVFRDLKKIERIELNDNNIATLDRGAFADNIELKYLYLHNNRIVSLLPGIFRGLDNLVIVQLQNNNLSTLLPGIFRGLDNLANVYLQNNNLSTLESETFVDNNKLRILKLQDNQIMTIALEAFKNLDGQLNLYLSNNHIGDLQREVFSNCPNIKLMELQNNRISSLHWTVNNFDNLQYLDLRGNKLNKIPESVFRSAPNLKTVKLRNNAVTELDPTSFASLLKLQVLDLADNSLTELGGSLFESCTKLYDINMGDNRIAKLHEDAFKGLETSLSRLDLSNNPLGSLPERFLQTHSLLSRIVLQNCSLKFPPKDLFNALVRLNQLDISNNGISNLNALNTTSRVVNVSNNQLENFQWDTHCRFCSFDLIADKNVLKTLNVNIHPEDHFATPFLNLYLADNNLTIPIQITCSSTLRYGFHLSVDLSRNEITDMNIFPLKISRMVNEIAIWEPCTEKGLIFEYSNINLNLSENNISFISPSACVGVVSTLDLSSNQLETIGPLVSNATFMRLSTLYLAGNMISVISPDAFDKNHGKMLYTLDLRKNRLTGFQNLEYLLSSARFQNLRMAENPIDCSCDLFWLRNASVARKLDKVRCHSPENVRGYLASCFPLENCPLSQRSAVEISDTTRKLCDQDMYVELGNLSLITTTDDVGIAWRKYGPAKITGYRLNYTDIGNSSTMRSTLIHQDLQSFTLYRLQPGYSYNICLTVLPVGEDNAIICDVIDLPARDSLVQYGIDNEAVIPLAVAVGICIIVIIALVVFIVCRRHTAGCCNKTKLVGENNARGEDMVIKNSAYETPQTIPAPGRRLNSYVQEKSTGVKPEGEGLYEDINDYENSP